MSWTDADLKIFAAGIAIGGKWNNSGGGTSPPLPDPIIIADEIHTEVVYGFICSDLTLELSSESGALTIL